VGFSESNRITTRHKKKSSKSPGYQQLPFLCEECHDTLQLLLAAMYQQGPQHVVAVGVGDQTLQVIWPSKPQHVDVPGRWLPVEDWISGNYVKYYFLSIQCESYEFKMFLLQKPIFNIAF